MKIIRAIHCKEDFSHLSDIKATTIRIDFEDNTSKYIAIQHPITNETLAEGFIKLAEAIK
jgi:hypothetical protein